MTPILAVVLAFLPALARIPLVDEIPDDGDYHPGWGLFIVVIGLVIGSLLLWFSMRKQLRKIDFEDETQPGTQDRPTS